MKYDIKVLVMDVDGTLTDGKIYMGNECEIMKAFNIKDGYGINNILKENSIIPVIITGRESKIVKNRCEELNIKHFFQGVSCKLETLKMIMQSLGISIEQTAYIGDDNNDLDCMDYIVSHGGIIGCPADSSRSIL